MAIEVVKNLDRVRNGLRSREEGVPPHGDPLDDH
jgi:hypothetical protein